MEPVEAADQEGVLVAFDGGGEGWLETEHNANLAPGNGSEVGRIAPEPLPGEAELVPVVAHGVHHVGHGQDGIRARQGHRYGIADHQSFPFGNRRKIASAVENTRNSPSWGRSNGKVPAAKLPVCVNIEGDRPIRSFTSSFDSTITPLARTSNRGATACNG